MCSLLSFFFLNFYAGLKFSKHTANGSSRIPQLSAYTREDACVVVVMRVRYMMGVGDGIAGSLGFVVNAVH